MKKVDMEKNKKMMQSAHKTEGINRTKTMRFNHPISTGHDPRKGWRIPLNRIKYNEQRDEETGYGYLPRQARQAHHGARYLDHELMTMWLSVDPLADKYPNISPYAYCMWNPIRLIDPNGMDTLNVKYNNKTKKWDIGTLIIAQGNDVINVTKGDGSTGSVVFRKGNMGKEFAM